MTPEDFFEGSDLGLAAYSRIAALLARERPDVTVRASKSQVAFRRRRGFAYLWRPTQYLKAPAAEVVLAIALHERLTSQRCKEVAHPARDIWMHHLEIHCLADLDAEVERWLVRAADEAA